MTTGLSAVIQARKPAFHVCLLATPSNRNSNANKICIGYNTTKLVSLCDHIIQHYTKNRKPFFQKASCSWEFYVMTYCLLIIIKSYYLTFLIVISFPEIRILTDINVSFRSISYKFTFFSCI